MHTEEKKKKKNLVLLCCGRRFQSGDSVFREYVSFDLASLQRGPLNILARMLTNMEHIQDAEGSSTRTDHCV